MVVWDHGQAADRSHGVASVLHAVVKSAVLSRSQRSLCAGRRGGMGVRFPEEFGKCWMNKGKISFIPEFMMLRIPVSRVAILVGERLQDFPNVS